MSKSTFIIETTSTGFSAYEIDEPVYTAGTTMEELKVNALDAINTWLEDNRLSTITIDEINFIPQNVVPLVAKK